MTTTPPTPAAAPPAAPVAADLASPGKAGGEEPRSSAADPRRPARPRLGELVRATGGPRYAIAVAVDALGSGMLRPFLLLYGIQVLGLGVAQTGTAMSAGMLLGLATMPFLGRWLDRGARSAAVASAMLIRVVGVAALLAGSGLGDVAVWGFAAAALFLGIGDQCWPPAHAALVSTLADDRHRDAALAAGRSLRNAGLGVGALIAMLATTGGTGALRVLAAVTALGYTVAALLVRSMRVTGTGRAGVEGVQGVEGVEGVKGARRGRLTALDVANAPYAFCFNVLEVALPAVLVTQLDASPAWSAGIFVGNTFLVVTTQIAVVVWLARHPRRSAMAGAGVVLAASYLGFWAAAGLGGGGAAAAVALVSVLYTAGEIMYTGSATALIVATTPAARLGRALARFQLTTGIGIAASPAVLMALFTWGPGALWATLATTTLAAALVVRRWGPDDRATPTGIPLPTPTPDGPPRPHTI